MSFWSRKTFCIISGASRGFGASMAITFAESFVSNSVIILIARNSEKLSVTRQTIQKLRTDLKVFIWAVDLAKADTDELKKHFSDLFAQDTDCNPSKFSQCFIIHNAASLGNISIPFTELSNRMELSDHLSLNLTSMILLNTVFFGFFTKSVTAHRYAMQISSMAGIKPLQYMGIYCGAKAARDMYFKVLALEEGENMRVLSYAPGVLDTEMFWNVTNNSGHPEVKAAFEEFSTTIMLTCNQSSRKLVKLLNHDLFENGSHIDYYDINEDGTLVDQESKLQVANCILYPVP